MEEYTSMSSRNLEYDTAAIFQNPIPKASLLLVPGTKK